MTPSPSRPFWIAAIALWLVMVAVYVHAGFQPSMWTRMAHDDGALPYPLAEVILFCAITAIEIITGGMIARPWKSPRLRRLGALLLVLVLWYAPWALGAMHQSPVRDSHMNWLLAVTACVLLALCTDAPLHVADLAYRWFSRKKP